MKFKHIIERKNLLRKLKIFGTSIKYPSPRLNESHELPIATVADASSIDKNGRIGALSGLLIFDITEGAVCYNLVWLLQTSSKSVKNVPAAKRLAAAERIIVGKSFAAAY